jgi:hypothetical protein
VAELDHSIASPIGSLDRFAYVTTAKTLTRFPGRAGKSSGNECGRHQPDFFH